MGGRTDRASKQSLADTAAAGAGDNEFLAIPELQAAAQLLPLLRFCPLADIAGVDNRQGNIR